MIETIRKLRRPTAQNYAVERTVGLDGKSYPFRREAEPARTVSSLIFPAKLKASEDRIRTCPSLGGRAVR
jgi:hypothetical protein